MARSRNGVTRMRNKRIRPTRSRSSSSYTSSLMGRDLFTADVSFGGSLFGTSSGSTEPAPQEYGGEEDISGISSEPIVLHGGVEVRDGEFVYQENSGPAVLVAGPPMGNFTAYMEEDNTPYQPYDPDNVDPDIRAQAKRDHAANVSEKPPTMQGALKKLRKIDPATNSKAFQYGDCGLPKFMRESVDLNFAFEQAWEESNPNGEYRNGTTDKVEQGGWVRRKDDGALYLDRLQPYKKGRALRDQRFDLGYQPDGAVASFHTHPNKGGGWFPGINDDDKRVMDKYHSVPAIVRSHLGYHIYWPKRADRSAYDWECD